MRYSEQFMEHIEYAFHAFCKIVLRHEAGNGELNVKNRKEKRSPDGNGWFFYSFLRSNTARIMAEAISCWLGGVFSHSSVSSLILLTSLSVRESRSR